MKAKLVFDLNDPMGRYDHMVAVKAGKLRRVLAEVMEEMRRAMKYGTLDKGALIEVGRLRGFVLEEIEDAGLAELF